MRNWMAVLSLALVVAASALMTADRTTAQQGGATSGSLLTGGLLSPRGMKFGPDGMLYVAEAGIGGDTQFTGADGTVSNNGFTGRISRIDPATGDRETVIDGLPSNGTPTGDAVGAADVAFLDGELYYLQTHGGEGYGFPDTPTGIYRIEDDGTTTLVADIGQFNIENPVEAITSGVQPDVEVGGNPYSMAVRDGAFWVVDGNHNRLMRVQTDGTVEEITEFPDHPVSTGIATQSSGPLYVSYLGPFPFAPEDGRVVSVGVPSGNITQVASGVSSLTDVEFGPGGQLYALSFGAPATSPDAPAPWEFGTGTILRVESNGTLTPLVTGLTFSTGLIFSGNTAFVTSGGITIPGVLDGEIWRIDDFTSIQPLTQEPAPAPQP
ncbi:MAG TPA: ScyD/ScyE family protein, partial [Dehalococcoidia bacterium]|nr:ScyD/ScyE family protein [Dehalococcoidia bacterium]